MKKKILTKFSITNLPRYFSFALLVFLTPFTSLLAQPIGPPPDFKSFVLVLVGIIDLIIPVVTGLIFVVFLWGMALFILKSDEEEARKKGKSLMIWGIVGLFIAFSLWSIIYILTSSFGFPLITPQLKTS